MKTFELTYTELHGMDDPTLVYHIVDNIPYHTMTMSECGNGVEKYLANSMTYDLVAYGNHRIVR